LIFCLQHARCELSTLLHVLVHRIFGQREQYLLFHQVREPPDTIGGDERLVQVRHELRFVGDDRKLQFRLHVYRNPVETALTRHRKLRADFTTYEDHAAVVP